MNLGKLIAALLVREEDPDSFTVYAPHWDEDDLEGDSDNGENEDFAQLSSNTLEPGSGEAGNPARLESDPAKILPQLLDQLISLGQTAQQLRRALSGNGHRPGKLSEVARQPIEGDGHAP